MPDGKTYKMNGGGGGSSTPAPNSVGSEEIKDESIKKQDLDKGIQDKLEVLDDGNVVTESELEDGWAEAMRNAGLNMTQEAGSSSGSASDGGDLSE